MTLHYGDHREHDAGAAALEAGLPAAANPWPRGSGKAICWAEGWHARQAALRERERDQAEAAARAAAMESDAAERAWRARQIERLGEAILPRRVPPSPP